MGIRMDQMVGLAPAALKFLEAHKVEPEICAGCNRPFVIEYDVISTFNGMFGDEYPLFRHELKNNLTADEYVQASLCSSGLVFFIALRTSDGEIYEWSDKEMETWL